jgi:hypothetical protein
VYGGYWFIALLIAEASFTDDWSGGMGLTNNSVMSACGYTLNSA